MYGGAFVLPPYVKGEKGERYSGTANAIYQNSYFIERYNPDYLLVLSGDHIYKMDYSLMIEAHVKNGADATIAVIKVPMEEASRFGILNTDENLKIVEFDEKPKEPKSDLASMGIYVFSWQKVKQYLVMDNEDKDSDNDFGKNILPKMLENGEKMFAFPFNGYWKDVGTIESLWEANMELLQKEAAIDLHDDDWKIFSRNPIKPPHYVAAEAEIKNSIVGEGCFIYGKVENSVLFPGVVVEKGATVVDSIIMQETRVKGGAQVIKSIIDEEVIVDNNAVVGDGEKIAVVGSGVYVDEYATVAGGSMIAAGTIVKK